MIKTARIYERNGKVCVAPYSRATTGVLVSAEPVLVSDLTDGAVDLGEQILASLEAYREGTPHPTDFKAVLAPLLTAAEVKSYGAFVKRARSVGVDMEGDVVTFTPSENRGVKGGFITIKGSAITSSTAAKDVGEAFARALELATRGE